MIGAARGGGVMSPEDEKARLKARLAELEAAAQTIAPASTPSRRISERRVVAVVVLGAVAILAVAVLNVRSSNGYGPVRVSPDLVPAAPPPPHVAAPGGDAAQVSFWTYSDELDEMTGRRTRDACVTSIDAVRLDFPYKPTTARLCIRNSPKYGLDAYFQLTGDGQILCTSYQGCTGHVRYDDGPRLAVSMAEPADHSSDTVFFRASRSAMAAIAKADVTRVELNYFQNGEQAVTFKTGGLDLSKLGVAPKSKTP